MRFRLFLLILLASLTLSACTTMVPRSSLPYPLSSEGAGEEVKVVTIPLPVIATSPNEGFTFGALTSFLVHNDKDEITTLVAPQVNYNDYFGTTFSLYGALYPSPDKTLEVNLSQATKVNNDYEIRYIDRNFLGSKLELNSFLYYWNDGAARFFGFQSESKQEDESNYDDREGGFNVSVGYPLGKHYQLVLGERFRKVSIKRGAVTSLPFIRDTFSEKDVPGINGFTTHAQRISLIYSTLDPSIMPTFGGYGRVTLENSAKILGSDDDYRHYEIELKGFIPFPRDTGRFITAFRLMYNQTLGGGVPFLERSIIGGENTLRGYGRNRFIDSSFLLFNLEERIRLFRWEVFHVNADWELAPFIDLGSVMKSIDRPKPRSFQFNPGFGIRAVVRPNIVGRLDVGFGDEGVAVYLGLGYPF